MIGQNDAQANGIRQRCKGTIQIHGNARIRCRSDVKCAGSFIEFTGILQGIVLAQMLQPDRDGETFEPTAKSTWLAQLSHVAPRLEKDCLRQIIRQGGISAAAPHQIADPGLTAANEFSERIAIAIAGQAHNKDFRTVRVEALCLRHGSACLAFNRPCGNQQPGSGAQDQYGHAH